MKTDSPYSSVSVVIPTLNSERTLELCLSSIARQKYKGKTEIIVADGGSKDSTLKIAKKHHAKIVENNLKTGEAGKAIGAKYAHGELVAFIDSDNILPTEYWLAKMIKPFVNDQSVIATEPLYFTYRRQDFWLTRYFALLGMGDPLSLFLGNYDRYSLISNKWTQLPVEFVDQGDYLILNLKDQIPTIGANGFVIKKRELERYPVKDYLFDIDVLKFLSKEQPIKVAKVKVGIVHLFSGNVSTFIRKQRRRIRDYIYFQKVGIRVDNGSSAYFCLGIIKFILATVLVIPLLFQAALGYFRKKDKVWLFHPLACWITLGVYGFETLRAVFIQQQFNRSKWSQ